MLREWRRRSVVLAQRRTLWAHGVRRSGQLSLVVSNENRCNFHVSSLKRSTAESAYAVPTTVSGESSAGDVVRRIVEDEGGNVAWTEWEKMGFPTLSRAAYTSLTRALGEQNEPDRVRTLFVHLCDTSMLVSPELSTTGDGTSVEWASTALTPETPAPLESPSPFADFFQDLEATQARKRRLEDRVQARLRESSKEEIARARRAGLRIFPPLGVPSELQDESTAAEALRAMEGPAQGDDANVGMEESEMEVEANEVKVGADDSEVAHWIRRSSGGGEDALWDTLVQAMQRTASEDMAEELFAVAAGSAFSDVQEIGVHCVLAAVARQRPFPLSLVAALTDQASRLGIPFPAVLCEHWMKELCRLGRPAEALELFDRSMGARMRPSAGTLREACRAAVRADEADRAPSLWRIHTRPHPSIPPVRLTTDSCAAYLQALAALGHRRAALNLLERMRRVGLHVNAPCVAAIILATARARTPAMGFTVLDDVIAHGLQPDATIVRALFAAAEIAGDPSLAEEAWDMLAGKRSLPRSVVHAHQRAPQRVVTSSRTGWERDPVGHWWFHSGGAKGAWQEHEEQEEEEETGNGGQWVELEWNVPPTLGMFESMLRSAAMRGDVERAVSWLAQFRRAIADGDVALDPADPWAEDDEVDSRSGSAPDCTPSLQRSHFNWVIASCIGRTSLRASHVARMTDPMAHLGRGLAGAWQRAGMEALRGGKYPISLDQDMDGAVEPPQLRREGRSLLSQRQGRDASGFSGASAVEADQGEVREEGLAAGLEQGVHTVDSDGEPVMMVDLEAEDDNNNALSETSNRDDWEEESTLAQGNPRTSEQLDGPASPCFSYRTRRADGDMAERLLWDMIGSGITPSAGTLELCVDALVASGHPSRAFHLVQSVRQLAMEEAYRFSLPETSAYSVHPAKSGTSMSWLEAVAPSLTVADDDESVFSPKVDACLLEGCGESATAFAAGKRWLRTMVEQGGTGRADGIPKADRFHFAALIRASLRAGEPRVAVHLIDWMRTENIQPAMADFNTALEAAARFDRVDLAHRVVAGMQEAHMRPDARTLEILTVATEHGSQPKPDASREDGRDEDDAEEEDDEGEAEEEEDGEEEEEEHELNIRQFVVDAKAFQLDATSADVDNPGEAWEQGASWEEEKSQLDAAWRTVEQRKRERKGWSRKRNEPAEEEGDDAQGKDNAIVKPLLGHDSEEERPPTTWGRWTHVYGVEDDVSTTHADKDAWGDSVWAARATKTRVAADPMSSAAPGSSWLEDEDELHGVPEEAVALLRSKLAAKEKQSRATKADRRTKRPSGDVSASAPSSSGSSLSSSPPSSLGAAPSRKATRAKRGAPRHVREGQIAAGSRPPPQSMEEDLEQWTVPELVEESRRLGAPRSSWHWTKQRLVQHLQEAGYETEWRHYAKKKGWITE